MLQGIVGSFVKALCSRQDLAGSLVCPIFYICYPFSSIISGVPWEFIDNNHAQHVSWRNALDCEAAVHQVSGVAAH